MKISFVVNPKSVEGTLAAFIAQLIGSIIVAGVALNLYDGLSLESFLILFWFSGLTALLETFTTQVDNLVLPLFLCAIMRTKMRFLQ